MKQEKKNCKNLGTRLLTFGLLSLFLSTPVLAEDDRIFKVDISGVIEADYTDSVTGGIKSQDTRVPTAEFGIAVSFGQFEFNTLLHAKDIGITDPAEFLAPASTASSLFGSLFVAGKKRVREVVLRAVSRNYQIQIRSIA